MSDPILELIKTKEENINLLKKVASLEKKQKPTSVIPQIVDDSFRLPEDDFLNKKKGLFSFMKSDKSHPIVAVILSPAGDISIRERIVDVKGNITIGKRSLYRVEPILLHTISDSDIKGFRGKKVQFYFQDVTNPIEIRRSDTGSHISVNTENYAKATKTNLINQLLSEEMTFRDYITLVLLGAIVVMNLGIILKVWFMN